MQLSPAIQQFLRFCCVGLTCYVLDACVMEALVSHGLKVWVSRGISITLGLQCGYLLHSIFTFRGHGSHPGRAWIRFMASNSFGATLNYLLFIIALHALPIHHPFYLRQTSLIIAVSISMWYNFLANRHFVFRKGKRDA